MNTRQKSGVVEQATSAVTTKATQAAGGFVGAKAGEYAAEVLQKYSPQMKRQWRRGARLTKQNPKAAAGIALVILAAAAMAYWLYQKD